MRNSIICLLLLSFLFSCSENQSEKTNKSNDFVLGDFIAKSIIEVRVGESNYEALLNFHELKYLDRVDFSSLLKMNWDNCQLSREGEYLVFSRGKYCNNSNKGTFTSPLCINSERILINPLTEKVLSVSSRGSGYLGDEVEFVYNKNGILKEYRKEKELFSFEYNYEGELVDLKRMTINREVLEQYYFTEI